MTGPGQPVPVPARRRVPAVLLAAAIAAGGCSSGGEGRRVYRGPASGAQDGAEGGAPATEPTGAGGGGAEQGTGDEASGVPSEPQVVPGGSGESPDRRTPLPVEDGDAAWEARIETARQAMAAGEDDLALEIVSAALRREPPEPHASRLRALRADVRAHVLGTDVLRADVRGVREYVPFETDVDLVVRLRNVGTTDVVIRPPEGAGPGAVSGSTLVLSVVRTDCDIYADEMSRTWTQSVPVLAEGAGELRIPPEGVHEVPVRIAAEEAGRPLSGLRVLEVSGDLRAGRFEAGGHEPFGRVRVRTGRVVVLPRNYEPLAADPVGSLRKAVAAVAPIHLLVATEFVPAASRPEAMDVLAGALAEGSPDLRTAVLNGVRILRRAAAGTPLRPLAGPFATRVAAGTGRAADLAEALHVLTGVSLPPDGRFWVDWWRKEAEGPGSLVPTDAEIDRDAPGRARPTPR